MELPPEENCWNKENDPSPVIEGGGETEFADKSLRPVGMYMGGPIRSPGDVYYRMLRTLTYGCAAETMYVFTPLAKPHIRQIHVPIKLKLRLIFASFSSRND